MSLRWFIRNYQDWLLGCAVVILLVGVGIFYAWGIGTLLEDFTHAIGIGENTTSSSEFRIDEAEKILRSRGVVP